MIEINNLSNIEKIEKDEIILKNKNIMNTFISKEELEIIKKEYTTLGKYTDQNITVQTSYFLKLNRTLPYFDNDDSIILRNSSKYLVTSQLNLNIDRLFKAESKKRSYSAKLLKVNRNEIYKKFASNKYQLTKKATLESFDLNVDIVQESISSDLKSKPKNRCLRRPFITNNIKKLESIEIKKSEDCEICYGPYEDPVYMECCNLKYCKDCVRCYVVDGIKNFNTLVNKSNQSNNKILFYCPNKGCHSELKQEFITNILTGETLVKYKKIILYAEIIRHKNNILCPIPDCDSYADKTSVKKKKLICIQNKHEFCIQCLKVYHKNSCNLDIIIDEKDAIKKKMRKCPKCKVWIEKKDGCNHMTCVNIGCGYEFCWICLGKYSSNHYKNPFYRCFKKSNEEIFEDQIMRNNCIAIVRGIGILLLLLIAFALITTLSSLVISIILLSYILRSRDYNLNFKSPFRNKLVFLVYTLTYILLGIGYLNLGFILIAVIIATLPGWLSVLICYRCLKYYERSRILINPVRRNHRQMEERILELRNTRNNIPIQPNIPNIHDISDMPVILSDPDLPRLLPSENKIRENNLEKSKPDEISILVHNDGINEGPESTGKLKRLYS